MGKGVIDHHPVKLPEEGILFHITADDFHLGVICVFALGNFRHFGGNIDAGDGCHIPLQIVVKQHTGAAGHIQNIHIRAYLGIVQNLADDPIALDHICIPKGGAAIKKFNNIFLFHSVPPLFSFAILTENSSGVNLSIAAKAAGAGKNLLCQLCAQEGLADLI